MGVMTQSLVDCQSGENFPVADSLVLLTFRALAAGCDHTFKAIMEKFALVHFSVGFVSMAHLQPNHSW